MLLSPYALVCCYQVAAVSPTAFGANGRKNYVIQGVVLTQGIFFFVHTSKVQGIVSWVLEQAITITITITITIIL